MPQSQLKARDGARCASWRGICQDQGWSSIWVAQSSLITGMAETAGRQLMAPQGCAAEENQHHSPQAGALRGPRILDNATMYWGAPNCTPSIPRPSESTPSIPEHPMWQFATNAGWHCPCCPWVTQYSPQCTVGPISLGQGMTQRRLCMVRYSQGRCLDIAGVVAWWGALGAHTAVAPEGVDAEITLAAVVLLPSALIHVWW